MTGYARRFIYPFGLTMAFAILVSMIVSFTLTPMLSSRWLKAAHAEGEEDTKHHRLFRALDRWYSASLRWTLAHPMWIIGVSAALVALTVPLNWMVGRTFVPAEDMNEFTVHADTPQGTSIEGTAEIARNVVKEIGQLEGVSQVAYIAGADRYTHFHLLFYLEPANERKVTQSQIMTQVRRVFARHPAYAASIVGRNPLGGGGNFKLLSEIPERMAPWIKIGQPLTLTVDAYPDRRFTATVSRISPGVNTQTRTFAFEALAPNAEALLKPGTFARVRLETSLVEQVMTIPYAAMQYRYGVYRAFAVEGDRLEARELKTGDRVGDRMEILDGLSRADRVAVTDVDTLTDGMKVAAQGE